MKLCRARGVSRPLACRGIQVSVKPSLGPGVEESEVGRADTETERGPWALVPSLPSWELPADQGRLAGERVSMECMRRRTGGKRHIPVETKQLLPVPRSYTNRSGISYSALFSLLQAPMFLMPPLYKPIQLVNTASSLASRQLCSLAVHSLCVFFYFALIYLSC